MLSKYNYLDDARAAAQSEPGRRQTTAQVLPPTVVEPKATDRGCLGTARNGGPTAPRLSRAKRATALGELRPANRVFHGRNADQILSFGPFEQCGQVALLLQRYEEEEDVSPHAHRGVGAEHALDERTCGHLAVDEGWGESQRSVQVMDLTLLDRHRGHSRRIDSSAKIKVKFE